MVTRPHRSISIAITLAALALGFGAHASPEDLFGFGAQSSSMGGLGATFAEDYSAVYTNPAGLSRAAERSFTLGYSAAIYRLWTAAPTSTDAAPMSIDQATGTTIGLTLPLPFGGILQNRVAIGLGFYTPTNVVVRGRIRRPTDPQFLVLADRAQSVALQLGIGVDLSHGFRIGAGFAALAAIVGTVLIAADATGRVGSRVDDQLVATYAPTFGASWDHGPFRLGAVYRGALEARFAVTITAQDIGLPLPMFNIAGVAQYDPWQLAFEAGYVQGGWTLALGGTFKRWSEFPGPLEQTTATSSPPPPVNFHDTFVVRAGGEHRWTFGSSAVVARAGAFYEPTPAPFVQGLDATSVYLDNDRLVGTIGLAIEGRALGTRARAEMFAQGHALLDRTSVETGNASIRYGGALYFVGLAATVTF